MIMQQEGLLLLPCPAQADSAMDHAGDRHLSYLPLAHIYERVTMVGVTHGGVSVGFYRCTAPYIAADLTWASETLCAHSVCQMCA